MIYKNNWENAMKEIDKIWIQIARWWNYEKYTVKKTKELD